MTSDPPTTGKRPLHPPEEEAPSAKRQRDTARLPTSLSSHTAFKVLNTPSKWTAIDGIGAKGVAAITAARNKALHTVDRASDTVYKASAAVDSASATVYCNSRRNTGICHTATSNSVSNGGPNTMASDRARNGTQNTTPNTSLTSSHSSPLAPARNLSYSLSFEVVSESNPGSGSKYTASGNVTSSCHEMFLEMAKLIVEMEEASNSTLRVPPVIATPNLAPVGPKEVVPRHNNKTASSKPPQGCTETVKDSSRSQNPVVPRPVSFTSQASTPSLVYVVLHSLQDNNEHKLVSEICGTYLNVEEANERARQLAEKIYGKGSTFYRPEKIEMRRSKHNCLYLNAFVKMQWMAQVFVDRQVVIGNAPDEKSSAAIVETDVKVTSEPNEAKESSNCDLVKASVASCWKAQPPSIYVVVHASNDKEAKETTFEICGSYVDILDANTCVDRMAYEEYGHSNPRHDTVKRMLDDQGGLHFWYEMDSAWTSHIYVEKHLLMGKGSEETNWKTAKEKPSGYVPGPQRKQKKWWISLTRSSLQDDA